MSQTHAVGQFLQGQKVMGVGQDSLTPSPQVDDAGPEESGHLGPRQARSLLEKVEGLGEVGGEDVGRFRLRHRTD